MKNLEKKLRLRNSIFNFKNSQNWVSWFFLGLHNYLYMSDTKSIERNSENVG